MWNNASSFKLKIHHKLPDFKAGELSELLIMFTARW